MYDVAVSNLQPNCIMLPIVKGLTNSTSHSSSHQNKNILMLWKELNCNSWSECMSFRLILIVTLGKRRLLIATSLIARYTKNTFTLPFGWTIFV